MRRVAVEFRGMVNTAIAVLLITGVVLSLSRLTADAVSLPYVGVLAAKIALALYMFYTVRFLQGRSYPGGRPTAEGLLGPLAVPPHRDTGGAGYRRGGVRPSGCVGRPV